MKKFLTWRKMSSRTSLSQHLLRCCRSNYSLFGGSDHDSEVTGKNETTDYTGYPNHVAIILDGNRRYATEILNRSPWLGHEAGTERVEELLGWISDDFPFIQELTLYSFSVENFYRKSQERNMLFRIFERQLKDTIKKKDEVLERGIRFKFLGRLEMFDEYSPTLRKNMKKLEEISAECTDYTANFCVAYGGQTEIVDGFKKMYRKMTSLDNEEEAEKFLDELDETKVAEFMYLKNRPDLIIRTGGRKRVSNFLLYQNAYAEWFFLEKFWPEFTKEDFAEICTEFRDRTRTFGK